MVGARREGSRPHPARTGLLPVLAIAASILSGCAGAVRPPAAGPGRPSTTAPAARPRPGYDARIDDLSTIDTTALAGRRIALDPGHGGTFRGALGAQGLTESEANLGVALHLRGLLEARGAVVFMTRTDDRDFVSPADSSLRVDLAERTRLANAFRPDLFVSIHHNADARGAHDVNETQTYYKLGDDGPSLEAAQWVHRYLVRNLGIEKHKISPGNYYVLRNSDAPGILTESSYITNPDVENRLALASKQRLEAEALLLGIARFFARRAPVIAAFDAGVAAPDSGPLVLPDPRLAARIDGAFDRAELLVNGAPVALERHGDRLAWHPERPLPAGDYRAVLRVRLAGEGSARERVLGFRVARPPARLVLSTWPAPPLAAGPAAVRIRVLDAAGLPVLDSLLVRLTVVSAGDGPRDTVVTARDGEAWAYVRVAAARAAKAGARFEARAALATAGVRLSAPFAAAKTSAPGTARRGWPRRMPEDAPLAGVAAAGTPAAPWLNRDGFAVVETLNDSLALVGSLPGYRPWMEPDDGRWPFAWTAIAGGALHRRRIVLDPDGGGDEPGGTGPSGARAATLNLAVARALQSMLEAAGAEVRLTRDGDVALSEVERVQITEAFRPDRFLRIGHRAEPPIVGYWFGSGSGLAWANHVRAALASLGLPSPPAQETAQYPLQQTSCPALYVATARVDEPRAEERLLAPGALRAEAYALYLGLAREWAADPPWPVDSVEVRDAAGQPVAGAPVVLGGALVLETGADGRVRFARTEPGPIMVSVEHPRARARTTLLDSTRGTVLTGSR